MEDGGVPHDGRTKVFTSGRANQKLLAPVIQKFLKPYLSLSPISYPKLSLSKIAVPKLAKQDGTQDLPFH